ncbi:MAG: PspC domain-containing protein [Bacteroidales bacterium]|nr:PspC domain-containing protein [Bacteroidales bacterium]
MKQALKINLGGHSFFIDEDAYQFLKQYLDEINVYFSKEKDGAREIYEDIEARIAELLSERLKPGREVINFEDVTETIARLGKVEDFEWTEKSQDIPEEEDQKQRKSHRKLYRNTESSYLGGVAAGLGSYFDIDPLWIRLIFFALLFANGAGIIIYIILWIVLPPARTRAQRLQMKGKPVTISTIEKSVSEEFEKVKDSMGKIKNSQSYQRTKESFNEMGSALATFFKIIFQIFISIIGIAFLIIGIVILTGISSAIFFGRHWLPRFHIPHIDLPPFPDIYFDPVNISLFSVCLLIVILIPVIALIYGGIKLIFNIRTRNSVIRATALTAWILSLIVVITMVITESDHFTFKTVDTETYPVKPLHSEILYLNVVDNHYPDGEMNVFSIFDYTIRYNPEEEMMMGVPKLDIKKSVNDFAEITLVRLSGAIPIKNNINYPEEIMYNWQFNDSVLILDNYFTVNKDQRWRMPEMQLILKLPVNQIVYFDKNIDALLNLSDDSGNLDSRELLGDTLIMTPGGLKFYSQSRN